MKKLLKILALWLVKILQINLVEPYSLEHLKKMIHSVTDDYSQFLYKPFFVELKALKELGNNKIKLDIPFLVDCVDENDVLKLIENFRNSLDEKGYFTSINTKQNIHTEIEPTEQVANNDETENLVSRVLELIQYESFDQRIKKAIDKVQDSQYFLHVDLLSGTSAFKTVKLPIDSYKPNYPGLQIAVEVINQPNSEEN